MRFKKLTIVSDTPLCYYNDNWYGFNAVVKEIECIEEMFDEIVWLGAISNDLKGSPILIKINVEKVKIVPLKLIGGKTIFSKLKALLSYPFFIFLIIKNIWNSEVIHTRLPSHPAIIAVVLSFIFRKKIWWNKFAGSWNSSTLPFFYRVQKNILILAKHTKVTINGFWFKQPNHCLSFENPCLYEEQIQNGLIFAQNKEFISPYVFVFVGRLDEAKGMSDCINSLKGIPFEKIEKVHFVGDSDLIEDYKKLASFLGSKVTFHGFLESDKVHSLLVESHFLLLPSKSEGFPKVIAEAACYGTIPVVSNVGSITHYINIKNGFLWELESSINYSEVLLKAVTTDEIKLKEMSKAIVSLAENFTFSQYKNNLMKKVLLND